MVPCPVYCDNVIVRSITIDSHYPNNDGCDPESTSNVLIEKCIFRTGDDAIAIKAGRDADGREIGRPSKNIVIRNCLFQSECNGLCIGSEMSGGVEPEYSDGEIVLVKTQPQINIGQIGIFTINDMGYIKKLGTDRLISVNPEYDDICFEEEQDIRCKGLVIGVLNEEDIVND